MTHGTQMRATWGLFMSLLGNHDEGLAKPLGLRPHREGGPTHKDNLLQHMNMVKTKSGIKKELKPFFDIMHRIFCHTLFPRVGNLDMVHGPLVDMLMMCHDEKGSGAKLDVSNIMWKEIVSATYGHHVPIYGPYIFRLIQHVWSSKFPEEPLPAGKLTVHETINLRQKDNGLLPVVMRPRLCFQLLPWRMRWSMSRPSPVSHLGLSGSSARSRSSFVSSLTCSTRCTRHMWLRRLLGRGRCRR